MENFSTFRNEDGIETFKCSICSCTFASQKSVKTHVTKKHTQAKTKSGKSKDKQTDDENEANKEEEFDPDESSVVKSTQVSTVEEEAAISTEEIFREYSFMNTEVSSQENTSNTNPDPQLIPNDTYDELMKEAGSVEGNDDDKESENKKLKEKIDRFEKVITEKNLIIDKSEADLLSSQLNVSSLQEEIKLKDEANNILMAEKNSEESEKVRVVMENDKITAIMHQIYKEKAVMKKNIEELSRKVNNGATNTSENSSVNEAHKNNGNDYPF